MNAELERLFNKKAKLHPGMFNFEITKQHTIERNRTAERHLDHIRQVILTSGLQDVPEDTVAPNVKHPQRPLLWKLLLRLPATLPTQDYLALISHEGPSPASEKIRNDSFRTLATDAQFKEQVGEERLVRLLDAYVWRASGTVHFNRQLFQLHY